VHVVQQAAHPFGGIQINLLDLQRYFKLTDLLLTQEILKLQRGFKIYLTHSVFTDAMAL
jgi:hypothetical protein